MKLKPIFSRIDHDESTIHCVLCDDLLGFVDLATGAMTIRCIACRDEIDEDYE